MANQPLYTVSAPVPQEFIPLYGGADATNAGGLEGSVRLDGSDDQYVATNVVGAGITALSGVFLGRMEDPVRVSGAYDHLMAILSLTGSGTHTLKLGMRSGGPPAVAFQPGRTWKWVLETFDGTTLRQVKEDLAGVEPVVLGFRYQGGATAGARLLELWRGDASGMTLRDSLTGAAVPQFLNLDAVPALGSGGDNNAGWQHADGTLANQCWQPAYLQSVMAKMAATTVLPDIYRLNLFGTGFDGNHIDGFSQGSCPVSDSNGRLHVLHNPGLSDPSHWPEYYTYLDPDGSGGYTLVSSTKIRDTASVSYFTFGSAGIQFAGGARVGELMALGSYGPDTGAYAVGNTGPNLWRCTNPAGSPPTWGYTDLASQIPAGIDYFWPCGKIFELTPGGTLITTFYGIKTGDAGSFYSTWIMRSTDQGSTWTVDLHVGTATGSAGTSMFEPCLIWLGGTNWALEMRSGATTLVTYSSDDRATWTPVVRMGANGTMPTQVQPGSYRCQDGTILRFIGVRDTGTASYDAGMRFGTLVARYDSTFRVCKRGPTPVDLALDGRCYHSTFYAGMKAGKHRVGLITSDDRVNLNLIISDEDYWQ